MEIKDIKDPKIQQMVVVNTIAQHPEYELGFIMEYELSQLFIWKLTQQGYKFWLNVDRGKPVTCTDKGLWYRHTEYGTRFTIDKLYQCKHDSYENFEAFIDDLGAKTGFIYNEKNFILATPEEVFNHLNPKRMEHEQMKGEELEALQMTIEKQKSEELKQELEALKIEKDKMINKGIDLVQQRDELNDLVDLIYKETLSIKLMNEIVSNIHNMISRFRTPSLVGTTQTVEIDGKKYEVTIKKEI